MYVLVHGVPETADLWRRVQSLLGGESVALAMPGFGTPRPSGFGATKDDYVDWLVGELDRLDGPIDLIGHDWGAGLTYRVATAFGDRIHAWSADVANVMHPDYVWHDFAQIWQTPGEGESFFETQLASPPEDQAQVFEAFGVPHDDAVTLAGWADETMGRCILDLYRSATPNPSASWGDGWAPTPAPGLVLCPMEDPFGDEVLSRDMATRLGARHELLEGAGHWWPLQAPEAGAGLLRDFFSSVD
jgi:pimeloyl-ACP methyl ester carboxylesterase